MNRVNECRDDILIHRATGDALNRISAFYGMERPLFIKEEYWREALRVATLAARGTRGVLSAFLEEVFGEYIKFATYTFTVLTPNVLQYTDTRNISICNLDSRYVKINGKRYFITHTSPTSDPPLVTLAGVRTSDWREVEGFTVGDQVQVSVLPYLLEEFDGVVKLIVDAGIFIVPPTYLREDASDVRISVPYGGHIMDLFSDDIEHRFNNKESGPNPAYPAYLLQDIYFERFFTVVSVLVVAGVNFVVESRKWCDGHSSIYASLSHVFKLGTADPDAVPPVPVRQ